MEHKYYLGVDGGGTKTAFALINEQKELIYLKEVGPSSLDTIDEQQIINVIYEGTKDINVKVDSIFLGIGVDIVKKETKMNRSNTIYIANLPEKITEETIESKFSKFGDIKTIRLIKDKDNKTKGFGYVDYETEKAMKLACEGKIKIKDKEIKIEQAKSSYIEELKDEGLPTQKRMGKKKKKAMINKAKEQLKLKSKEKDD